MFPPRAEQTRFLSSIAAHRRLPSLTRALKEHSPGATSKNGTAFPVIPITRHAQLLYHRRVTAEPSFTGAWARIIDGQVLPIYSCPLRFGRHSSSTSASAAQLRHAYFRRCHCSATSPEYLYQHFTLLCKLYYCSMPPTPRFSIVPHTETWDDLLKKCSDRSPRDAKSASYPALLVFKLPYAVQRQSSVATTPFE